MELLLSQSNQIRSVLDTSPFPQRDFQFDDSGEFFRILYVEDPSRMYFVIKTDWRVQFSPGEKQQTDTASCPHWTGVVQQIQNWLRYLKRELDEAERLGAPAIPEPEWAVNELPPEYREIVEQLVKLEEEERRMRRMASLLWESGEPLNRIVRDAFRAFGFAAEHTKPGSTYDVTVTLPAVGRLLIEVTGIEGQVTKKSKKIAQVLDALRTEAAENDRVCLALNAYRTKPPSERAQREIVSGDALALLEGLKAPIFTTSDLFDLWKVSREAPDRARAAVQGLYTGRAGIVRLLPTEAVR